MLLIGRDNMQYISHYQSPRGFCWPQMSSAQSDYGLRGKNILRFIWTKSVRKRRFRYSNKLKMACYLFRGKSRISKILPILSARIFKMRYGKSFPLSLWTDHDIWGDRKAARGRRRGLERMSAQRWAEPLGEMRYPLSSPAIALLEQTAA